jgi:hypothetical protein
VDDEDFDSDPDPIIEDDPLETEELEPPSKKQKIRDVSHLTKRFKGSGRPGRPGRKQIRRPPGKMNEPLEDLIYVSDVDADDPDDF